MSHKECFKEFNSSNIPPTIYTDTSFIVEALVDGQKHQDKSNVNIWTVDGWDKYNDRMKRRKRFNLRKRKSRKS